MRFYSPRTSVASFLFVLLLGGFIGWKSALYTVRDERQTAYSEAIVEVDLQDSTTTSSTPLDLNLFWEVYSLVQEEYVDANALDAEDQLYGAIKGMVRSLDDPYTEFLDPEESISFQQSLDGTLEGIGAELTVEDGALVVIAPIKGSPADQKGLQSGDIIYKIDDQYTSDLSLFEAIMSIRGEEGTTVALTILRSGLSEPLILEIERAKIQVPNVELTYQGAAQDLAYINLYQFTDTTEAEFDEVVQSILLRDVKGVILDLRYNGGGYLDVSIEILSDFLEGKQTATLIKHRNESDNEILYTNESGRLADFPLVVLVNGGSASASEILAGAIQDHERGLIIGEQTFGKGSVQVVESLEDGSSLRMTVAKWHTPDDRSIDDVGIIPDMVIEITEEDAANGVDSQLEAAIRYLEEQL